MIFHQQILSPALIFLLWTTDKRVEEFFVCRIVISAFEALIAILYDMNNNDDDMLAVAARSRWADWWLRIIMQTMFDAVAKPITSGIELCRATAPTALPMDHATEADDMEPIRA